MKKTLKLITTFTLLAVLAFSACSGKEKQNIPSIISETADASVQESAEPSETEPEASQENQGEPQKKNKDIVILATSDVHCSPQKGFGYAGLYRIREKFLKEGCEVLLIDDGDEIEGHGELYGTVTKGEQVIDLMNKMGYDVATPGNHDFNYGADWFVSLASKANYPYISCNITKNGKLVFQPYIIKEVAGKKIAFVGVTTPKTIGFYTSESLFQNDNGKVIYDFKGGKRNQNLFTAVQSYANYARAAGADYVFLMSHFGQAKKYNAWDNITTLIASTKGIDAVFDGHSHDAKKLQQENAEGQLIDRIAMGSKFSRIGYLRISGEDGSITTGIFNWNSSVSASELFGIKNEMSEEVDKSLAEYKDIFYGRKGENKNPLYITNPNVLHTDGTPVKYIDKAETNIGDYCADAFRALTGADVAFIPADKFNDNLPQGEVSLRDFYMVLPNAKRTMTVNATGQQILDALEWSVRLYPQANPSFLQVSGVTFKINTKIKTPCKSKKGKLKEIKGDRRVSDVKIGGVDIDPEKTYRVTSYVSVIRTSNGGYNMFKKCKRVKTDTRLDFQLLYDYMKINLNGVIGNQYVNPTGNKRITVA